MEGRTASEMAGMSPAACTATEAAQAAGAGPAISEQTMRKCVRELYRWFDEEPEEYWQPENLVRRLAHLLRETNGQADP